MSERSVIISVGLALLMLGVWLGVDLSMRGPNVEPIALLDFEPAAVDRMEVTQGQSRVWIEREEWLGSTQWVIRWGRGGADQTWPADETRVRAALRVLATTTLDPGQAPVRGGGTLSLRTADGAVHTLEFDDRPIAGRIGVSVRSSGRATGGLTDAALFDAFVRTGLLAWRDERVLLSPGVGPSRVFIEAGREALALARRDGRWTLLEPLTSPADPDAAGALIRTLAGLRVERFMEDLRVDDDRTGLDHPLARIEAEHDFRVAAGNGFESKLVRQTLTIGGATDLSGATVHGLVEWTLEDGSNVKRSLVGPVVVAMSTEQLNKLTTSPGPYVSKVSTILLPSSIQDVSLSVGSRSVHLERLGTTWAIRSERLFSGDAATISGMVELLCQKPAERVVVGPQAAGMDDGGVSVKLVARGGAGSAELIVRGSVDPVGTWVVDGRVQRFYAGAGELAAELTSLVERLGAEE
ncbi:MAG: hypothetical protein Kow0022_04880 [Phycisphaerales bacterium]